MQINRRETLALGLGAAALTMLPYRVAASTEEAVAAFTGGADVADGGVTINAPEIAENGNTVPIGVDAPGAAALLILATGNPNPEVGIFNFGPMAGSQAVSTRIRLAGTQDVLVVAKMGDGSFKKATAAVKVTIGGCGG